MMAEVGRVLIPLGVLRRRLRKAPPMIRKLTQTSLAQFNTGCFDEKEKNNKILGWSG
jgi:hypothetical protein